MEWADEWFEVIPGGTRHFGRRAELNLRRKGRIGLIILRRLGSIRLIVAALIVFGVLSVGTKSPAQSVGPSFPCAPTPVDALARLACSVPGLGRADLRMVQTYYALRQAVGPDGQKSLKNQFLSFVLKTRQMCGLPPVQPKRDQSAIPLPGDAANCVATAYKAQRFAWTSRLSGPAAEEAARAPEQNILLQGKLQALGLAPKEAVVDGVFGTGTRSALLAWQHAAGRPETGFFGDNDADVLLGVPVTPSSSPDLRAGLRGRPLAQTDYRGKSVAIGYKNLQVLLDPQTSHDPKVCQDPNGGGILGIGYDYEHQNSCETVIIKVLANGKNVFEAGVGNLADQEAKDLIGLKIAILYLDSSTSLPQVIVSGYTGGAHCCTSTVVVTDGTGEKWQPIDFGKIDGDEGFDFLSLLHDGSALIVDRADGFLYRYSSYAGSNAPTRIRRLNGSVIEDVTKDPRYQSFLLGELRDMTQAKPAALSEPNGYLAGWVAEKALVGQLEDGWRVMLASYDHQSAHAQSACAVAQRVWVKSQYSSDRVCPASQTLIIPFPETLAVDLVEEGYITSEQSARLGYDIAKIEANRKSAMETATAQYEQWATQGWFVITHAGNCVRSETPASPSELVATDRANGLEDDINMLEVASGGKPMIVRVGEPKGNGLESIMTFYRGLEKCEDGRQRKQNELDNLK